MSNSTWSDLMTNVGIGVVEQIGINNGWLRNNQPAQVVGGTQPTNNVIVERDSSGFSLPFGMTHIQAIILGGTVLILIIFLAKR